MNEKILVCIANKYSDRRLKYIKLVIENYITHYGDVKIIIDTDNIALDFFIRDNFKYSENTIEVIVNKFSHPYHLCWAHRNHIFKNREYYDYFIYTEDDLLLPYENFISYKEKADVFWPKAFPAFIRIETKNDEYFNVDCWVPTVIKKNEIIEINNYKFIKWLHNPHQALWILKKEHLKESLPHNFVRFENSIENASNYLTRELHKDLMFEITDDFKIKQNCWIYHLPNNYSNTTGTIHGKLKFTEMVKVA